VSFSLTKEARLCFMNGVFEVFATRIEASGTVNASATLRDSDGEDALRLESRAVGEAGNRLKYAITQGAVEGAARRQMRWQAGPLRL